jgi:hypothetical protein
VSREHLEEDANGDRISPFTKPWSDGTTSIQRSLVYPQIYSADVNDLRLLATFGEMGSFDGLAPFSCPQEERKNRFIAKGSSLHFLR